MNAICAPLRELFDDDDFRPGAHRRLWRAVIVQMLKDAAGDFEAGAQSGSAIATRDRAVRWAKSMDCEIICDFAELPLSTVRSKVTELAAAPARNFHYRAAISSLDAGRPTPPIRTAP